MDGITSCLILGFLKTGFVFRSNELFARPHPMNLQGKLATLMLSTQKTITSKSIFLVIKCKYRHELYFGNAKIAINNYFLVRILCKTAISPDLQKAKYKMQSHSVP